MTYLLAMTWIHTLISLVALVLGIPVVLRLLGRGSSHRWADWFLIAAVATTLTGFLFPFRGITPAFAVGLIASALLAVTIAARALFHLRGRWRWIYADGLVVNIYLLAFVGVVQAFQKVPLLNGLAPTQTELPFLVAQVGTLVGFVVLGILAALRFKEVAETMAEPRRTA